MREADGTAVQHKQAIPQSAPRLDLVELLEAPPGNAAGRFLRHLLARLIVSPVIGGDCFFAHPPSRLQKILALFLVQVRGRPVLGSVVITEPPPPNSRR